MILKIQDSTNSRKWHYKDNIADISFNYSEYTATSDDKLFFEEEEIKFDYMTAVYVVYPKQIENIVVAVFIKNGNEGRIAFNTQAYLLNDEGKTVEKIS